VVVRGGALVSQKTSTLTDLLQDEEDEYVLECFRKHGWNDKEFVYPPDFTSLDELLCSICNIAHSSCKRRKSGAAGVDDIAQHTEVCNLYSWAEQDVLEELGLQVHKKLADVPLVLQRLFASRNADGNDSLDSSELAMLVRDVARRFEKLMTSSEVQAWVRKILAQLSKDSSGKVTCQEFVEYVKVNPETFGPLMV
jgi:hypothetical protein